MTIRTLPRWRALALTAATIGSLAVAASAASASTITVDDDKADCPTAGYTSIQAAVDAAAPHDTIAICPGTYVESSTPYDGTGRNGITIRKPLTLKGAGADKVFIEPAPTSATLAGPAPTLLDGGGSVIDVSRQSLGATDESEMNVVISGVTVESPDVYAEAGITFLNASGTVVNSVVGPLHRAQTTAELAAAPLGWGIVAATSYRASDSPGAPRRRVVVQGSRIYGYQAGGIRIDGATQTAPTTRSGLYEIGEISDSVIQGSGPDSLIPQTGVEFHSGAHGFVSGSRIAANDFPSDPRQSVGVLATDAEMTDVYAGGNVFAGNGYAVFNANADDSLVRASAPFAATGNDWGGGAPLADTPNGISGNDATAAPSVVYTPALFAEPAGVPSDVLPTADAPPTVGIGDPLNGQSLAVGSTVTVQPIAGDDFGVKSVTVKLGDSVLGTVSKLPYAVPLTVPAALAGTTQSLTAIATDSAGQTSSETIAVKIVDTGAKPPVKPAPPVIGAIGGLPGSRRIGGPITLRLSAPTATRVTVTLGKRRLCTLTAAPFRCLLSPRSTDVGTQSLTITATDGYGSTSTRKVSVKVLPIAGAELTAKLTKLKGGGLRVSGRLVLPAGVTKAQGYRGAKVVLERGAKKVTAKVSAKGTYTATITGKGKVRVSFAGTSVVAAAATLAR